MAKAAFSVCGVCLRGRGGRFCARLSDMLSTFWWWRQRITETCLVLSASFDSLGFAPAAVSSSACSPCSRPAPPSLRASCGPWSCGSRPGRSLRGWEEGCQVPDGSDSLGISGSWWQQRLVVPSPDRLPAAPGRGPSRLTCHWPELGHLSVPVPHTGTCTPPFRAARSFPEPGHLP